MKATILAPGSRGDVQPYIAIGQALVAAGHECTIVTTLDHEALVRAYGLGVATIPVNVAEELGRIDATRALEGGGLVSSFREFAAIAKRSAHALAEVGLHEARHANVVVTNFSTVLVADAIAKKLGLPLVQAFNVPLTTTSEFAGALFPALDLGGAARRLGHRLTRAVVWSTARASANEACVRVLGAKRARLLPGSSAGLVPGPLLYGFSEAFLPRPADWGSHAQVTGFWFVEEPNTFTPPADLVRFLGDGPPPVCIGFGSMSTEKPEQLTAIAIEAANRARRRLVLLSGWAGLAPSTLGHDVVAVTSVPHSWLYPRCSAVVHHGGAGTTAAALRAGIPAVVVPFHGDQPFWGSQVHERGVGPAAIPRRRLTAARLADALETAVTSASIRERASRLGELIRAENGAARAATAIASAARA